MRSMWARTAINAVQAGMAQEVADSAIKIVICVGFQQIYDSFIHYYAIGFVKSTNV